MLTGNANILLDALKIGATGSMSGLANILGSEINQVYNMFNAGQEKLLDKAQLIQNRLMHIDYAVFFIIFSYGFN